jgi:hypothetical protein
MQSFSKPRIVQTLQKVESALYECIQLNTNVENFADIFTNDFAFYLFKYCVQISRDKNQIPEIKYVCDASHVNAFLLVNDVFLFGVNDDGKVFVLIIGDFDFNPAKSKISELYRVFRYDYDIVDCTCLSFNDIPRKVVKFVEKDDGQQTIKLDGDALLELISGNDVSVRVAGDLILRCSKLKTFVLNLAQIFEKYVYAYLTNELSRHGLIMINNTLSFLKNSGISYQQTTDFVENIARKVLNDLNIKIIGKIQNERKTALVLNIADEVWHLIISPSLTRDLFTITVYFKTHMSQLDTKKLFDEIVKIFEPNLNKQTIVLHLGNHKIIVNGWYLPVIQIGNEFQSLDNIIAHEIILEHPEHHTVHITFSNLVLARFETIQMHSRHQKLRNKFAIEKLKAKAKEKRNERKEKKITDFV